MEYLSLFNLNSVNFDEDSQKSRALVAALKSGRIPVIKQIPPIITSHLPNDILTSFLDSDRILVPVPRSSLKMKDSLFPSYEICKVLCEASLGLEVDELIKRKVAIRKSSEQRGADNRPSVQEHIDSLEVVNKILSSQKITIVDDVLSLGRTGCACYMLLKEIYPDADIKFVAVLRTKNIDPETFYSAETGTITYTAAKKAWIQVSNSYPHNRN